MTTIVIDEKSKLGKLIMNLIKETNCGKIIDTDKAENLDNLIKKTESDIRRGRTKKIETADLWK
jgi:hypothetical protein